jgi:sulfotransferase family protein
MQRILVVGCPRSGTTLLQTLLGAHENILTFTESHFFDHYFSRRYRFLYGVHPALSKRIPEFLRENGFGDVPLRRPLDPGIKTLRGAANEAAICTALFDDLAAAAGKTAWLEKTPWNFRYISLLSRAVPDAKVVHIVRPPLANVVSLKKVSEAWNWDVEWRDIAAVWVQAAYAAIAAAGHPNQILVLYEDLVRDPDAVTRRLLRRLGFDERGFDAAGYAAVANRVITAGEYWKARNREEIRPTASEEEAAALVPPDIGVALVASRLYDKARRLAA